MVLDTTNLLQPLSSGQSSIRRLTFVPATKPDAHSAPVGVDLVPLNDAPQMPALPNGYSGRGVQSPGVPAAPKQQRELFSASDLMLQWTTVRNRGAGYHNLGNTCFMNSVLQALVHTPPLAELFLSSRGEKLLRDVSGDRGGGEGYNPVAITLELVRRSFSIGSLAPHAHAKSLRLINKRFRLGRQEDSHEFLRCLLDAMHEACLKRFKPKPPPELATTTFIYRIFGGKLRSQIECEGVDYVSRTYDPFLDLSLEINRAPSLERALGAFTAPEVLDGANMYRCPKNNKLVRAVKRISIEEAPNVLTIHLKRFEYGGYGAKINKKVEYGTVLDLRPYMSSTKGPQQLYELYGVLVHYGHSVNSGHYICYVRASSGMWHLCDDHQVTAVGEKTVLDQRAYILFYVRRQPRNCAFPAAAAVQHARLGPRHSGTDNGTDVVTTALGPALQRRPREEAKEAPADRTAKRARQEAPGDPGRLAAAGQMANGVVAKAKGDCTAATSGLSWQHQGTVLALMLANLAENKQQLRAPQLKATAKQVVSLDLGKQQLQVQQPGEQQQDKASGPLQQQASAAQRDVPAASTSDHDQSAQNGGNGTGPCFHAMENGVHAAAVVRTPTKFAPATEAGDAGCHAADAAVSAKGVAPTAASLQQEQLLRLQQQEQAQQGSDTGASLRNQQLSHLSANGSHSSRPGSVLKVLHGGLRRSSSVWYAAKGQLRHAAAGTAAASHGFTGTSYGHSYGMPAPAAAAAAEAEGAHAGAARVGRPPRAPSGRREGEPRYSAAAAQPAPHELEGCALEHGRVGGRSQIYADAGAAAPAGDLAASVLDHEHEGAGVHRQRKKAGRLGAMKVGSMNGVADDDNVAAADTDGARQRQRESGAEEAGAGTEADGACIFTKQRFPHVVDEAPLQDASGEAWKEAVIGAGPELFRRQQALEHGHQNRVHAPGDHADAPATRQPKRMRQDDVAPTANGVGAELTGRPSNGTGVNPAPSADGQRPTEMPLPKKRHQTPSKAVEEVVTGEEALAWLTGGGDAGSRPSSQRAAGPGSLRRADGQKERLGVNACWDGVDEDDLKLRHQVSQLNRAISGPQRHIPTGGREYDEWDQEYDRGRMKKVRNRRGEEDDGDEDWDADGEGGGRQRLLIRSGSNIFQKAASEGWRSDSKGGRGRSAASRGGERGRGRGRGRGGSSRSLGGRGRSLGGRGRSPGGRGGRVTGRGSPRRGRGSGRGRGGSRHGSR